MSEKVGERSPWWYRRRGALISAVYGFGFLAGYAPFRSEPDPVFVVWGSRFASGEAVLLWCAVASALAAWLWRAAGTAYLRRHVVFASDVQSDRLIVAGPFRYVRNPLYLGNMFLALAVALLMPPVSFCIILFGNAVLVVLLAGEESRQMAARYGADYEAFRAAVPAFVPRLTPATVPGSAAIAPAWGPALFSEGFSLALAVAIVPSALGWEFAERAFWIVLLPALLFFSVYGWRAGRRSAP